MLVFLFCFSFCAKMRAMKKKSTGKKVVKKRKAIKRVKKEVLLKEVQSFVVPETQPEIEKPIVRERVVAIQQIPHPPVSPYVISFEVEKTDEPLAPVTSFEYAPDASRFEEFALPEALDEIVEMPAPESARVSAKKFAFTRGPSLSFKITKSVILNAVKNLTRMCADGLAFARDLSLRRRRPIARFTFEPRFVRALAGFVLVAVIFTLPASGLEAYTRLDATRASITTQTKSAFTSLGNNDTDRASRIENAHAVFTAARTNLENTLGALTVFAPLIPGGGKYLVSSKSTLSAGVHLTEALRILNDSSTALTVATSEKQSLTARLLNLEDALRSALPLIQATTLDLDQIDTRVLPVGVRASIETARDTITEAVLSLREMVTFLPAFENFLGLDAPKRYIVAFQNPDELRPTGGFIGSFALLDLDKGEIKKLEVPGGGSYDLQGGLRDFVSSPAPLHLIEPRWQFHDANWFPDFPTSAQKLMWFYEHSDGPTVDGVIAVNASLVPKLLSIVGPIEMSSYGRTFTADNFITETQKIVELEYDRTKNKPKAVIGDLAPILISRLLAAPPEKFLNILTVIGEAAHTKEIQVYASDSTIEAGLAASGVTGEMKKTDGDYLMMVSSNIGGGKSDAMMNTKIALHTTFAAGGGIVNRLELTRIHQGKKGDQFSGVRNVSYVRVYVPQGSELISATGFEAPLPSLFSKSDDTLKSDTDLERIVKNMPLRNGMDVTEEFGHTVFGNWMQVDPGASQTATLTYRLPFGLTDNLKGVNRKLGAFLGVAPYRPYTLLVQSQSGLRATFDSTLDFPPNLKPQWQTGGIVNGNTFTTHRTLDADAFVGLLLDR